MKLLLTGATGFIGSALLAALLARGHEVVCAGRRPPARRDERSRWVRMDFARCPSSAEWRPHLQGVHAVINTVGLLRESRGRRFDALHVRAPLALFEACVEASVGRVVQLSALGADEGAASAYHRSKRDAAQALLALPLDAVVVEPSLVFAPEGASASLFLALAALPLLPLPGGGRQRVQPIHRDDLVEALCRLVEAPELPARRMALVGPEPIALADYLQALRRGMGLPRAPVLAVPMPLARLTVRLAAALPGSLLDPDSLAMLERGNAAPAQALARLLGRAPRSPRRFIGADLAVALRMRARLALALPLARLSLALLWIVTALLSFGLYPVADSYALLERADVPAALQPLMLHGAAGLDLLLGVACLVPWRRRRLVWLAQAALIVAYTAIISWKLPDYWLHPYGPVLKNLPLLALLGLLLALDEPRRDG